MAAVPWTGPDLKLKHAQMPGANRAKMAMAMGSIVEDLDVVEDVDLLMYAASWTKLLCSLMCYSLI